MKEKILMAVMKAFYIMIWIVLLAIYIMVVAILSPILLLNLLVNEEY